MILIYCYIFALLHTRGDRVGANAVHRRQPGSRVRLFILPPCLPERGNRWWLRRRSLSMIFPGAEATLPPRRRRLAVAIPRRLKVARLGRSSCGKTPALAPRHLSTSCVSLLSPSFSFPVFVCFFVSSPLLFFCSLYDRLLVCVLLALSYVTLNSVSRYTLLRER